MEVLVDLTQVKAVIFSLEGLSVTDAERALFAEASPLGYILFARNCESVVQIRALSDDLRSIAGWHCPILIDQEGGRVQRLKPPVWRQYPPMKDFGDVYAHNPEKALEDLRYTILQLAEELVECGVDVNCAPVLDVLTEVTHNAIGDRAFSSDPDIVGRLGVSVCRTLLSAGVTPVIKHIPGHGRGACDSHKNLPRVCASIDELQSDYTPFRAVVNSDIAPQVWGMVAHIVYEAIDAAHPASVSATVIGDVIRGEIGFDGFLLSDDLDMDALAAYGNIVARAIASLEAGCDAALHCSGKLDEMEALAKVVPNLSEKARERLQKAVEMSNIKA